MKKIISYCLLAILALVLAGCTDGTKTYELSLTGEDTVEVGNSITLTASIDPEKEDAVYEWSSENDAIATVDENGVVTGVAEGSVKITVTVENVGSKSLTISVEEGEPTLIEYTPIQLKTLLTTVLNDYSSSNNGSVKIVAVNGEETLTSELIYNLSGDTIQSLMYKLSGNETAHVYVKDGYAYMLRGEEKTKSALTSSEAQTIIDSYLFDKYIEKVSEFYSENAFYGALSFVSREENVLTYSLDLAAYVGSVFNTEGKDSITVKVTLSEEKVVKVETLVVVGDTTNSTTVTFEGLTQKAIQYPDFSSYIG